MLMQTIEGAPASGARLITLGTHLENTSARLYARIGYRQAGVILFKKRSCETRPAGKSSAAQDVVSDGKRLPTRSVRRCGEEGRGRIRATCPGSSLAARRRPRGEPSPPPS